MGGRGGGAGESVRLRGGVCGDGVGNARLWVGGASRGLLERGRGRRRRGLRGRRREGRRFVRGCLSREGLRNRPPRHRYRCLGHQSDLFRRKKHRMER